MTLFIFLQFGSLKLPKETTGVNSHGVLLVLDHGCLVHLGQSLSPHKSFSIQHFEQVNYSSE